MLVLWGFLSGGSQDPETQDCLPVGERHVVAPVAPASSFQILDT